MATSQPGPSGLANRPRPFVFRASHLDGQRLRTGDAFHFDLHVFLRQDPGLETFSRAFRQLGEEGLGASRGKADLQSVSTLNSGAPGPVLLPLCPPDPPAVPRLRICFQTPTELKSGDALAAEPEFGIVFSRARDRVATLSALYGAGHLDLDFHSLGERAAAVRMTRCDISHIEAERRSSRTGQRHPLGGFIGEAEYEGALGEFLPILKAAEWTGIGRQTVWGKGQIRCFPLHA